MPTDSRSSSATSSRPLPVRIRAWDGSQAGPTDAPLVTPLTGGATSPDLVASVRYRLRGWNGHRADPVQDTRQALKELRHVAGPLPVVLVGHSMGARAALRAADDPQVRGVVALAPWCPPGEPTEHLADRMIMALHDEADRITSATDTWNYLTRARAAGARVRGVRMHRGRHAMIRDARLWHRLTTTSAAAVLGLTSPPCSARYAETAWSADPMDASDITLPGH
ncbi:alpha/beta fold hydrolase [Streptomyces sp. NPDC058872]|uniref:alpha/beta fold hydrolase n=1 Tax=Streptomyces sp. NPDC058872 TaxID=3346661 RepID=UPI00368FC995